MKLKRDARTLKSKAIASLRRGLEAFNSHDEQGRTESVLLYFQHCSEMLIKAILVQKSKTVFDNKKGTSIGLERAINLSLSYNYITSAQAGSIRSIDAMRDAAQHWMIIVPEDALYINCRALITTADELLQTHLDDSLAENIPTRVLPLSTLPLTDFDTLIDREYTQITELLGPKKRARDEARGRIRTLLAMEAHVSDTVSVSERDIDRIERAIKIGTEVERVFPRLMTLASDVSGEGPTIKVRITKKEGPPIRYISGDDPEAAAAIREVDLQKKYYISPKQLAIQLGLSTNRCKALRTHLNIDSNASNVMVFEFGSQKHPRYSDNALRILKESNTPEIVDLAWRARGL
ncbi:hypothetical protein [Burkholderia gladioli]|uniref:hypothetical protein n=1 Tax=Burkholderia gladioli TaxID=28095 RepID=UPI00163E50B3|nr:hypothetical protein [Burkholderia gladioli]MBJ9673388.1 hypothetical protein [Burkholderia gladioli]MDN7464202.1 hypothetical protein [Burkholderia gladioli]